QIGYRSSVFKDHLVKWCIEIIDEEEFNTCFKAMTVHPGLQHFKKGILTVSQWTGTEHKEMERIFLGVLAGAVTMQVLTIIKALINFIHFTQLQSHTPTMLKALQGSLDTFHFHKDTSSLSSESASTSISRNFMLFSIMLMGSGRLVVPTATILRRRNTFTGQEGLPGLQLMQLYCPNDALAPASRGLCTSGTTLTGSTTHW
ncbi:hypothetical protein K438DRAFT_2148880, partial [Mycena galopus ATCC 62051]